MRHFSGMLKAALVAVLVINMQPLHAQAVRTDKVVPDMTLKAPVPVERVYRRPILAPPLGPAPQNVNITSVGPVHHTLVWDRLAGISGYNVFANNSATGGAWVLTTATPLLAESYTDATALQPGAQYRVTALYPDGRQGSTDIVYPNPPQTQMPGSFSAAQVGPGQVRLSWQVVNFAVGYRLFGPGQPQAGTPLQGNQLVLSNLADGTYSWQVFTDYGTPWPAQNPPTASITLKSMPTANYRVVANGLRVMHETSDDPLSLDGMFDEVYGAFAMFHFDRRSSQMLDRDLRKTLVHGDTNNHAGRVHAGTASPSGGLRGGDVFPAVADPSQRYGAPPGSDSFPFLIWQGPLTDGQDAVIIIPTLWEFDGQFDGYNAWFQSEVLNLPRTWSDVAVQQALSANSLAVVAASGWTTTSNGPVMDSQGAIVTAFASMGMSLLAQGQYDRPIGLIRDGASVALPHRALVLTREVLERAFLNKNPASATVAIPLIDAPGADLQGSYMLYIQVERL
jgi:hypothetical protein